MYMLQVRNLTIPFVKQTVSFSLRQGETLGIVGVSGCGKSSTAKAILRLLPPSAQVQGEALFQGIDLLSCSERTLRSVRGREIGFVFQDPVGALNPTRTIGAQIVEPLLIHKLMKRKAAYDRASELLSLVGMETTPLSYYPHQLSKGMCQRIVLAIALAPNPTLLIADEPTTALDVETRKKIFDLLHSLRDRTSVILISHEQDLVKSFCDQIFSFDKSL